MHYVANARARRQRRHKAGNLFFCRDIHLSQVQRRNGAQRSGLPGVGTGLHGFSRRRAVVSSQIVSPVPCWGAGITRSICHSSDSARATADSFTSRPASDTMSATVSAPFFRKHLKHTKPQGRHLDRARSLRRTLPSLVATQRKDKGKGTGRNQKVGQVTRATQQVQRQRRSFGDEACGQGASSVGLRQCGRAFRFAQRGLNQ